MDNSEFRDLEGSDRLVLTGFSVPIALEYSDLESFSVGKFLVFDRVCSKTAFPFRCGCLEADLRLSGELSTDFLEADLRLSGELSALL